MKKINLSFLEENQTLEKIEEKYLFSYLYRFNEREKISLFEGDSFLFSDELLIGFRECIYNALNDLVVDCYVEPPIKQRQKHSTFFEKINFNNKKLILNYTTSELGRLMYTLHIRLLLIDSVVKENGVLKLEFK